MSTSVGAAVGSAVASATASAVGTSVGSAASASVAASASSAAVVLVVVPLPMALVVLQAGTTLVRARNRLFDTQTEDMRRAAESALIIFASSATASALIKYTNTQPTEFVNDLKTDYLVNYCSLLLAACVCALIALFDPPCDRVAMSSARSAARSIGIPAKSGAGQLLPWFLLWFPSNLAL